jgi:hypothetical protein
MPHPYVVFADHLRGFQSLAEALDFAEANPFSVVCERRGGDERLPILVEVARHDFLYDREHREWRVMMRQTVEDPA